jgi:hypothetical protein
VNEPDISPLAKRLAEENNVRWQELKGSGAGGKVVERDVLEYLACGMAGEEAIDPTPEPVPDGMEAWPEEDVGVWQRDNGALDDLQAGLSAAERVDDDLVFDADASTDDDGELISEDIFLFDDGEPEVEAMGTTLEDDELLISGDEDLVASAATSQPETLAVAEPVDEDLEALEALAALPVDDAAELDDDLPDLFASTDEEVEEDVALFAEAEDPLGVVLDEGDEAFDAFELDDRVEAAVVEDAPVEASLEIDEPEVESVDESSGDLELPESELDLSDVATEEPALASTDAEADITFDDDEPMFEATVDDAADWDADGQAIEADADNESIVAVTEIETSDMHADDEIVATVGSDLSMVDDLAAEDDLGAVEGADLDAAVAASVVTEALVDLPLVSHGALLRRHIDLTALAAAQLAVGRELGLDDPVAPAPFLVRAAAKALARVELGGGTLGVAGFDGGVSVNELADAATMPFTELIDAVADADGGNGDVALVVADMSEFEIDEAVLHLDAPVLILGRVLYDNQKGSYRSTLSLSGDIAPDRGGRLLARIAELLDAPVQLVM